jgi:hypothetical protein
MRWLILIEQAILGALGIEFCQRLPKFHLFSMTICADGSAFPDLGTRFREAP